MKKEFSPCVFQVQRLIPSCSLIGWGGMILFFQKNQLLPLLQHPRFHLLTLATAWVLILLGILRLIIPSRHSFEDLSSQILREILLLSPLLFFICFPFNQNQVNSLVKREHRTFTPSFDPDRADLSWIHSKTVPSPNLVELLLVCSDPEERHKLDGKIIALEGQFLPSERGYKLSRLFMFCCVADVQTIVIGIDGTPPPNMKEGDWFHVEGKIHFSGKKENLVLLQKSVRLIPPPSDIYLYYTK